MVAELVSSIATIAAVRVIPFGLCAALRVDALPKRDCALLIAAAAVILGISIELNPAGPAAVLGAGAALAYFACVATAFHFARAFAPRRPAGRLAWFCAIACAYLVVPASVAPSWLVPALVLQGWELIFSTFSYTVDASAEEPGLGEALFFVLVNPVLVFPERSSPGSSTRGASNHLRRVIVGLGSLAAQWLLLATLAELARRGALVRAIGAVTSASSYLAFFGYYLGQCFGLYLVHSGVAAIDIGCMGLLGHQVPERYERPFLAPTPADFWRRWNTYLGSWARRYLFFPTVLRLRKRLRVGSTTAMATAVLATFGAMGLLHGIAPCLLQHHFRRAPLLALTAIFAAQGALLLAWEAARRAGGAFPSITRAVARAGATAAVLSWLLLRQFNCVLAWVAIPALSRGAVPVELGRILGEDRRSPSSAREDGAGAPPASDNVRVGLRRRRQGANLDET